MMEKEETVRVWYLPELAGRKRDSLPLDDDAEAVGGAKPAEVVDGASAADTPDDGIEAADGAGAVDAVSLG